MLPRGRLVAFVSGSTKARTGGHIVMTMLDLVKATFVCGGGSLLIYSYPVVGQVILISMLALLWFLYARETVVTLRRR